MKKFAYAFSVVFGLTVLSGAIGCGRETTVVEPADDNDGNSMTQEEMEGYEAAQQKQGPGN